MNFKHTFFLSATVLLVSAGGAFAQVKKKPTPSPKSKPVAAAKQIAPQAASQTLPTDPFLLKGTLPNGLTYYIRSTAALAKTAELALVSKAGSVLETDAQRGYSHLINHLALKGTSNLTEDQLAGFAQLIKGKFKADSNAISSYDESVYRFTVPTDTADALNKGLNLLASWAGGMSFDAAKVNAAKTAVTEELKNSANVMKDRLDKSALPFVLNNSRYSLRNPKGEAATVAAADAATLKSFYTDWYRPNLQAIIVVGDVDAKQVEASIKTIFSTLAGPAAPKPVTTYGITPVVGTQIKFVTDKDLPYVVTQLAIAHPQLVTKTVAGFRQNIQLDLFNDLLAARMDEFKQQSNSPFLFAQAGYNGFIGNQDAFIATIIANARAIDTAVKTLGSEIERIRKFGFVSTELERAKQNALSQISYEYGQRDNISPGSIAADYQRNFISGIIPTGISFRYKYYLDNISKIDLSAMNALAAKLLAPNRTILLQAPETEKALLPTEQVVRAWFATGGAALKAYEDNASIPLMEKLPVAGKVTSIRTDSTILTTFVTLSNGVKVILKPTQFQPGQIIMNGYAFGGTSLASDQDFTSADLAVRVIGASGVAGFSQTQLERMLRNKSVNIAPYTGDIIHGFTGFTTATDFETAIQLLHLYFTQPRKDIAAWQKTIADTKGALVLRAVEETSALQDTTNAILSGYKKRGMTTTIADLNAASLDKGFQFYKDRFSNAANFTFTFTGSFTVEAIVPFLETYLGSLPTKTGTETFKNLGIHPPAGNITRTIVKGKGTDAVTQLIFNGTYDYNPINNIDLDALETILYLKMAQRIKDTTGNIQVGVRVSYAKLPESRYRVNVDIQTPVADLDRITSLVMDEISKFKQNGAEQKELNTFVLDEAKNTQLQLRQNAHWSGSLNIAAQNGDDPDKILLRAQMLQQITLPRTKEAAIKYLNDANLIKLTLLPEKK